MSIFRRDWWPGPAPTIEKGRIMCSDCRFHSSAMAGWQWDRCHHPDADYGSVVRNDQLPRCADIRDSSSQCGRDGKWFEAAIAMEARQSGDREAGLRPKDDSAGRNGIAQGPSQ